ncbi:DUF2461 domain-containing protein [Actinocorallia longicatena]|uniref:DUF2461 domain-containing protein n=1 Tax=Actinocorallia longicatena TaxID=111803 RepID=A0ABP6PZH9_9ACTN
MMFTGFPDETFEFFEGLAADNSRSYWQANKHVYDACVAGPLRALFGELEEEFGEAKLFRPYRDVRFAKDKSPYKTHLGGLVDGYYFGVDAGGITCAGGFSAQEPDRLARYRAAVTAPASGLALEEILAALTAEGLRIEHFDAVKTRPRGVPADHPRVDLMRYKMMYCGTGWPPEDWVTTAEAADRVRATWRLLTPLVTWGRTHLGDPEGKRFG